MIVYILVIINEYNKSEYVDNVYINKQTALEAAEELNQNLGDEFHVDVEEHVIMDFNPDLSN